MNTNTEAGLKVVNRDGIELFIPLVYSEVFMTWHNHNNGLAMLLDYYDKGVISKEVTTLFYNQQVINSQKLLDLGIFTSKHQFRTGYDVYDNQTGQRIA